MQTKTLFFAMNHNTKTAQLLSGFSCWEQVQGAFRVGIQLANGAMATGIGRCKSVLDLQQRAARSQVSILG